MTRREAHLVNKNLCHLLPKALFQEEGKWRENGSSINQSIKVFLEWPKWHCHCNVHCRCKFKWQ